MNHGYILICDAYMCMSEGYGVYVWMYGGYMGVQVDV